MTDPVLRQGAHDEEMVPVDDAVIGRAFFWSLLVIALAAAVAVGFFLARYWAVEHEEAILPKDAGDIRGIDRTAEAGTIPAVRFHDIASQVGIDFVHFNGATGEKLLPETMGGGCAIFDYDNDGHQDVLLVDSWYWPHDSRQLSSADLPRANGMRLYRNDGTGNFTDVSVEVGLGMGFYGMGVAVGDTNNDGNVDLFFTAVGPNHFYRNIGGRFVEATAEANLAGDEREWSTSAGFFDMNLNGLLDLFVCNYIQWSRAIDIELNFTLNGRDRAYGPPTNYRGAQSYLYRNQSDSPGVFDEVGESVGIHVNNPATGLPMGKALALAFADVNHDGLLDVFIANDTTQNFLFVNNAEGTPGRFTELGARSGVAFSPSGQATGAMGIDAAQYRNDDSLAVAIGNFANEMTSFYVSQTTGRGAAQFSDEAIGEGIGSPTRIKLSFGLFFFDYDLDGRLDLLQANGHLEEEINQIQSSQHYEQPAQLFWNAGPERRSCYVEVPADSLGDLSRPIVGRGAAYGDLDGDGDLDVLLTQIGGPPLLLRNEQELGHNWLRVKLIGNGVTVNRDAIGAMVELTSGGVTQRRMVMPTKSYLSQVELPVTFGFGENEQVELLEITWPGGQTQRVEVGEVNRLITVRQHRAG